MAGRKRSRKSIKKRRQRSSKSPKARARLRRIRRRSTKLKNQDVARRTRLRVNSSTGCRCRRRSSSKRPTARPRLRKSKRHSKKLKKKKRPGHTSLCKLRSVCNVKLVEQTLQLKEVLHLYMCNDVTNIVVGYLDRKCAFDNFEVGYLDQKCAVDNFEDSSNPQQNLVHDINPFTVLYNAHYR